MPKTPATPAWALALIGFCTLLIATAQVLMKMAADTPFPQLLYDPLLIISIVVYLGAGVLVMVAFKHGELSVLYPVFSLGFIWVMLASVLFLGESLTATRIGGTAAIIIGISIIGHRGSRGSA